MKNEEEKEHWVRRQQKKWYWVWDMYVKYLAQIKTFWSKEVQTEGVNLTHTADKSVQVSL